MRLFEIDEEKCVKCGACVDVCPMGIVLRDGEDEAPHPHAEADENCIQCGHCVCACKTEAFKLASGLQDRLRPVGKAKVEPETFAALADARRSVRAFKSRKIEPDLLRRMIDAVRDAPTGKNSRSVKWLMISDDAWIRKLSDGAIDWMRHVTANAPDTAKAMRFNLVLERHDRGVDPILFGAPHLAVAYGDARAPAAQYNGVIALTWLELAAPTFGVGACWAGFLYGALQNWEPLKTVFELPEHHVVHGALMIGYPKYRYKKIPPRPPADIRWL